MLTRLRWVIGFRIFALSDKPLISVGNRRQIQR
jgi:hypothetical protein